MRTHPIPRGPRAPELLPLLLGVLVFSLAGCGGGGGGGGGGAAAVAEPEFAFVANGNDNAVSRLRIDPMSGEYVHDGYQVLPMSSIEAVALHPGGGFLYVAGDSNVVALRVDGASGALTQVNQVSTTIGSGKIVFHPSLPVAYLGRRVTGTVLTLSIDPVSGAVGVLSTVATTDPVDIDLDPSGTHLFAVNRGPRTVTRHTVGMDGTLGAGAVVRTEPQFPTTSLAFLPAGDRAYLTLDAQSSNVRTFAVDPGGNFTLLDTDTAGSHPTVIEVDPAGAFAYAGNSGNDNISVFAIDPASGQLAFQSSEPTIDDPFTLAFSPDGTRLLAGSVNASEFLVHPIGPNGALDALDRYVTRGSVRGIAMRAGVGVVPATNERVYVPHPGDGTIHRYDRDPATGALGGPWSLPSGDGVMNIAFHPNGRTAYAVSAGAADVEVLTVDPATGNLAPQQVASVLPQVSPNDGTDWIVRAAVDPSGRILYVLDNRTTLGLAGRILWYTIAPDGSVAYGGSTSTGWNPENFVIHPAGEYLYVFASWGDQIQTYEIAATTGALSVKSTLGGYDRALQGEITPDGRYLYVAVENEARVYRFTIQSSNGFPTNPQWVQKPSPAEVRNIELHPNGDVLYVLSADSTIARFAVDPQIGTLAYLAESPSNGAEWFRVTADGRHAYGVSQNGVQVFAIDPVTLGASITATVDLMSLGTYQRTLTLE